MNLREMFGLRVPIISVVIGRGRQRRSSGHRLLQLEPHHGALCLLCGLSRGLRSHPVEVPGQGSHGETLHCLEEMRTSLQHHCSLGSHMTALGLAVQQTVRCPCDHCSDTLCDRLQEQQRGLCMIAVAEGACTRRRD